MTKTDDVVLGGVPFVASYKPQGATPFVQIDRPGAAYFPHGSTHNFLEVFDGGVPMVMIERADHEPLGTNDGPLASEVAMKACAQNPRWNRGLRKAAETDERARDMLREVGKGFLQDGRWTFYEACE